MAVHATCGCSDGWVLSLSLSVSHARAGSAHSSLIGGYVHTGMYLVTPSPCGPSSGCRHGRCAAKIYRPLHRPRNPKPPASTGASLIAPLSRPYRALIAPFSRPSTPLHPFFGESSLLGMNYSTRDGVCSTQRQRGKPRDHNASESIVLRPHAHN